MSVFKTKKSGELYWYDFQINGHRFYGSTKCTSRKEAEKVEAVERDRAKALTKAAKFAAGSLQIDHVAARYWDQVGQHHAGSDTTERDLARLVAYFGPDKSMTEITDGDVAKLVAWRRGQQVVRLRKIRGKLTQDPTAPLIAPATVNRSTTEVLKKLFTFAKGEGVSFEHEPSFKKHWLKEPEERVRELHDGEADAIGLVTRDDYRPLFDFVRASGLRQAECVQLKWSEVNWGTRQIVKLGKGRRRVTFPITDTIRQILWPLQGHHTEYVFTYVAEKTIKDKTVRDRRYPMTLSGVKTRWRRMRAETGISDFRFHDFRHDFGTKLLRKTGNLKLVQKAMNHADLKTTARYAHVLDDEVAAAVEDISNSRVKSRDLITKVV
jgi:integrase